jgi:hypothetical protein
MSQLLKSADWGQTDCLQRDDTRPFISPVGCHIVAGSGSHGGDQRPPCHFMLPNVREVVQVKFFDVSHNVAGSADIRLADKLHLAITDARVLAAVAVCTPRMGGHRIIVT